MAQFGVASWTSTGTAACSFRFWQLAEMLQSTDFWYAHAYVRVCSLIERDSPELLRTKSTCAAPPRNLSLRLCKLHPIQPGRVRPGSRWH